MLDLKKLNGLTTEELIDEIRNRDLIINNLINEAKKQCTSWRNYYRRKKC